jgi:TonB family protein
LPVYSERVRKEGVEGDGNVFLEVKIASSGNVDEVNVLRSEDPALNQAAEEAAKQWQYEPTLVNGVAVPVTVVSLLHFDLEGVQLRLILPNGTITGFTTGRGSDVNFIDLPGVGYLGFGAKRSKESSDGVVTVSVYELRDDHPKKIDSVDLTHGAGIVQTATKPAFGIELN